MKKTFRLEGLDCANCAAKIEKKVKAMDGVKDATGSFFAQKLVLEADDLFALEIPLRRVMADFAAVHGVICGISRRVPRVYLRDGAPVRIWNDLEET